MEDAVQIRMDDLVPLRGCHLAQRAVAVHSGVVDEDVHRAEVAGGQGQDLVAFLRPGEIALDDARPSAALLDLARERRRLLLAAAVMDGERGAFESQRPRNRASDPPRGPGDDGNFSSETRAFDRLFTCRARLRALAHAKLRRTAAWAPSPRSATVSVRWIQLRDGSAMILATSEQRTRPARVGPPERRTYIERDGSGRREASDPSRTSGKSNKRAGRPTAVVRRRAERVSRRNADRIRCPQSPRSDRLHCIDATRPAPGRIRIGQLADECDSC